MVASCSLQLRVLLPIAEILAEPIESGGDCVVGGGGACGASGG